MGVDFRFAVCGFLAGALAGCSPATPVAVKPSKPAEVAEVEAVAKPDVAVSQGGNVYRSEGVGLTVTAPEGWYVADEALMGKVMGVGLDIVTSDMERGTKAAMKAGVQRVGTVFFFLERAPGTPGDPPGSVMSVAEDVSMLPGIKRGTDYFFNMRRTLEQTQIQTEISDTYEQRMIGGQLFDRMDVTMHMSGMTIMQRHFAVRHGDRMVLFAESYQTPEQLAALDAVLDSIMLDW